MRRNTEKIYNVGIKSKIFSKNDDSVLEVDSGAEYFEVNDVVICDICIGAV